MTNEKKTIITNPFKILIDNMHKTILDIVKILDDNILKTIPDIVKILEKMPEMLLESVKNNKDYVIARINKKMIEYRNLKKFVKTL